MLGLRQVNRQSGARRIKKLGISILSTPISENTTDEALK